MSNSLKLFSQGIKSGVRSKLYGEALKYVILIVHAQVRAFAGRILDVRKDATTLGKRWMAGFLKRNPILKTKKQFKIDSARVNGATSDILKAWFQKLGVGFDPIDSWVRTHSARFSS